jgi:hypothetical protein
VKNQVKSILTACAVRLKGFRLKAEGLQKEGLTNSGETSFPSVFSLQPNHLRIYKNTKKYPAQRDLRQAG